MITSFFSPPFTGRAAPQFGYSIGIPLHYKLLLTLRPYAYGEDVILDDIYGNLGEDVVVEWRERYGEDVPIVAYMIPESMQAEMFAILGEGLWFDSAGTAKQVNCIELAQSPEINQWAVWYRLDADAGLGNREVLFYNPDTLLYSEYIKISNYFKNTSGLYDAILYYDAEEDPDTELTGGPSTFNSSILGPQYRRNADGTYTAVPAGGPIVDTFDDGFVGLRSCGAVTNLIPNSEAVGASVGVLPTGWVKGNANGITVSVVGAGAGYVDVRFYGTVTGIARAYIHLADNTVVAATTGETFTSTARATLVAGQLPAAGLFLFRVSERNSSGTSLVYLEQNYVEGNNVATRTMVDATTAYCTTGFITNISTVGATVDFTIRISRPQLTKSSYPQPYIPTTGTSVTQPASNATTSGGNWFTNSLNSDLWQALTGAPLTMATRIKMGVGSGDLPNSTQNFGIISGSASTIRESFVEVGSTGNVYANNSRDGTAVVRTAIGSTWPRNAIISRFTQVNTAGTRFRVGYMIIGTHTTPQWSHTGDSSTWAAYDGSFNPSTLYRLMIGYNNPYPMWLNKLAVWKRQVSDAELLEVFS